MIMNLSQGFCISIYEPAPIARNSMISCNYQILMSLLWNYYIWIAIKWKSFRFIQHDFELNFTQQCSECVSAELNSNYLDLEIKTAHMCSPVSINYRVSHEIL